VDPADIPEDVLPGEEPGPHVERLAREKAAAVSARHPGALVLAGDTVVVTGGEILGKPIDQEHAVEMLLSLSGREHEVVSGLALAGPEAGELSSIHETARVTFRALTRADALAYVATGEPLDKAGAYGIQGMGGALVTRVEGDYYGVVGLPFSGLVRLLEGAGWGYRFGSLVPLGTRPTEGEAP
jgi:septum formation protein